MTSSPHYDGQAKLENDRTLKTVSNGKRRVTMSPLSLKVTWGGDGRYWKIDEESGTILLHQVSWLEVTGKVKGDDLIPGAIYSVKFKVKMQVDAFGWSGCPVYLMAKPEGGKYIWKSSDLSQLRPDVEVTIPDTGDQKKTLKFTAPPRDQDVTFGLLEIWRGRWKGGLEIIQVIIEKCD